MANNVSTFKQNVNDVDFYCELRGKGPTIVLVPSGEGDCGSFGKVADMLADEFTVFTFDMRGMSRSGRPKTWTPITMEMLASDVAGLIKARNLGPATLYGCSSGGQCVLSVGLNHPEVARNLMVHEAALLPDSPIPDQVLTAWNGMIQAFVKMTDSKNIAASIIFRILTGDEGAWNAQDADYLDRVNKNGDVWIDLMLGHADNMTYTAEQLQKMPPLVFSVGVLGMTWLALANMAVAQRAKAEIVHLLAAHYPQITNSAALADHIRKYAKKYLK